MSHQNARTPTLIDLTAPDERAFLIGLDDPRDGRWPVERSLAELAALAETAGALVVGSASQRRARPDPATYFGKGRAAELVDEKAATGFNLLIVDDELSAEPAAQPREAARLQGARPLGADHRHLRPPRHARARGACRSSWPRSSTTCRA